MSANSKIQKFAINDAVKKLRDIISEKSARIYTMKSNIETLDQKILKILEIIKSEKIQIKKEEPEIAEMEKCVKFLEKIPEINIYDPASEADMFKYVEAQSIISSVENTKIKNSLTAFNDNILPILKEMQALIKENDTRYFTIRQQEFSIMKITDPLGEQGPLNSSKLKLESPTKALLSIERKCKECNKVTKYIMKLGCRCEICISCLKTLALNSTEGKLLLNAFEAQKKKQNCMYACPHHRTHISPIILGKLFSQKELEESSINALKRQMSKGLLGGIKYPNVCSDCKNLIKNELDCYQSYPLCKKHKVCSECSMYVRWF